MKETEILAIPRPANMHRYYFKQMIEYAESKGKQLIDLSDAERKMFRIEDKIADTQTQREVLD